MHEVTPLCDIPSGCCFFTGPWTVTRSSLRMLRRVAAFCRPLQPVLVSFPHSRSPVVGVLGLCWMWHGVPFARQRRPVVGVLQLCWLVRGSFDCFCTGGSTERIRGPSGGPLGAGWGGPGRPWVGCWCWCGVWARGSSSSLSPSRLVCPWWAPLLLRKQPIWAAGDHPNYINGLA